MQDISEKVVWLIDASSDIGEALAYALNKMGCRLILSARNAYKLSHVKARCNTPEKVEVLPPNMEEPKLMQQLVAKAIALSGQVDILVNNAGISQSLMILDSEFQVYKKLMDINYLGTVALSNALLPYFIARKQGYYVIVSSHMGKFGSPFRSGYCAAKHSLHGFLDEMRMEQQKEGVSVMPISPGVVNTGIAKML